MKNLIRKILGILFLFLGWYTLCNGITSILTTISLLVSMKDRLSFGGIKWLNIVANRILLIGLILVLIGTSLWSWQQRRIIFGVVSVAAGVYSIMAALLVIFAPPPTSEGYHVPTLIIGYIFFAMLSIILGLFFIVRQRKLSHVNKEGIEHIQ